MTSPLGGRVALRSCLTTLSISLLLIVPSAVTAAPRTVSTAAASYIVQILPTSGSGVAVPGVRSTAAETHAYARAVDRTARSLGADLGFRATHTFARALSGFAARLTPSQVAGLARDRRVLSITRSRPIDLASSPEIVPTGVRRVNANGSPLATNPVDVDVAIIDTGVSVERTDELDLPDLPGPPRGHNCFADGAPGLEGEPTITASDWNDRRGHGTHVAGIVGAIDNSTDVIGVAPGARIWPIRIFGATGGSDDATIVCAIDWILTKTEPDPDGPPGATRPQVDVINMSLEGPGVDTPCSTDIEAPSGDPMHDAICRAVEAGITVVVAAGNYARDAATTTPAAYDEVITVSAMSDTDGAPGGSGSSCRGLDDRFADYSNYGPDVDLVAPGSCIVSLGRAVDTLATMTGTSMATPLVAGAAALYLSDHPRASPVQVKTALRASATLDYATATDPDGDPDRLLDVSGLTGPDALTLWATPTTRTVGAGSAEATFNIDLTRAGGFSGTVDLSVVSPPSGVTPTFDEASLTALGGIDTTARLAVSGGAASGVYDVTIRATANPAGPAVAEAHVTLAIDHEAPIVDGPNAAFLSGSTLGSFSVPLALSWSGTDSLSGLERFVLEYSVGGQYFGVPLPDPLTTSAVRQVQFDKDYRYRLHAEDNAGNASDTYLTATPELPLDPNVTESTAGGVAFSSGWMLVGAGDASGDSYHRSKTAGSSVSYAFTGRSIAWVAPVGPNQGRARVIVDGASQGVVNLFASAKHPRRLVFVAGWTTAGPHTIQITVRGGASARLVGVDAFTVLEN